MPVIDEGFLQHTHETLHNLRQHGAVCPIRMPRGTPSYLVTGYEVARSLLSDPRLSKDNRGAYDLMAKKVGPENINRNFGQLLGAHMLNTDPPDHTRLRKLVNKAFTSRAIAGLRPRIEEIATELLDAMAEQEQADVMAAFAGPLPITVICELLGVREEDRGEFSGWSNTMLGAGAIEDVQAAVIAMHTYLVGLVAQKRAEPGDDLLSGLVLATDEGDSLSEEELVSMAFLLLVAGHETTVNLIGNATLALLRAPEQRAKLAADPALMPGAVEEFLRFDGPINIATLRYTVEDVEIGDDTIPAGEFVQVSLLAANRDEQRFPDPADLDVTRAAGGHLAFGHGIHYCVGAPLARLEAEVALNGLLARFPNLKLAVPEEELTYRTSTLVHGLQKLPVVLA
ncbi:cytochrome P450 [Amycolatopsis sp. FDAARGOS 1241]|uniref:cytochrome P450 family protein n=1 Tax=Amycolatopsis sp. FDAARGOS 1241 TaxID=2778070 RepID=UPI00195219AB|nr:cytochrome P450 [Amycolatopsis sp. FDAARGOS 1241]QRP44199.1 cytochrome P450 [Amycolatopsis sp. FDAARGOS 1241]